MLGHLQYVDNIQGEGLCASTLIELLMEIRLSENPAAEMVEIKLIDHVTGKLVILPAAMCDF